MSDQVSPYGENPSFCITKTSAVRWALERGLEASGVDILPKPEVPA